MSCLSRMKFEYADDPFSLTFSACCRASARIYPDSTAAALWIAGTNPAEFIPRLYRVDPNLERALNRLGIYHYHQIARFETSDVEWLVEHIEGIPPQMIRDSWIGDASRLSGVPPGN